MNVTEFTQLLSAVGGITSPIVIVLLTRQKGQLDRQDEKIEAVHVSTNGMSIRNEAIARKLGVEEGKATEKANPK